MCADFWFIHSVFNFLSWRINLHFVLVLEGLSGCRDTTIIWSYSSISSSQLCTSHRALWCLFLSLLEVAWYSMGRLNFKVDLPIGAPNTFPTLSFWCSLFKIFHRLNIYLLVCWSDFQMIGFCLLFVLQNQILFLHLLSC